MQPKIVMVSNYINHHQIPFCNAMYARLGENFTFIQTEPMEADRAKMGWGVDEGQIPYVVLAYEDESKAAELIMNCDLLLAGWTLREDLYRPRLEAGKLTLRISERIYREGRYKVISPRGLYHKYMEHIRFRNKPVYLLCNGSYVAGDFNLIKAYPGKKYKFGYFPETRIYESWDELSAKKAHFNQVEIEHSEELPLVPPPLFDKPVDIVWAGRFMELKHPEFVVRLASDLVRAGYRFHIHLVGDGELFQKIKELAEYELIEEYITMYGFLKPEEVRNLMETCHIHLFTSNQLEGWGAVVNEAMNAGCACVVNNEVGAANYLINDGINGMIYHKGSYEEFREKVITLLESPALMEEIGHSAYETILGEWNAEMAAARIIDFYEGYEKGEMIKLESGPMSLA